MDGKDIMNVVRNHLEDELPYTFMVNNVIKSTDISVWCYDLQVGSNYPKEVLEDPTQFLNLALHQMKYVIKRELRNEKELVDQKMKDDCWEEIEKVLEKHKCYLDSNEDSEVEVQLVRE